MKKMLYRLSLLTILVSLVSPALAAADPARAAPDRGFLAFLNALQAPVPMAAAAKGKDPSGGVSAMSLCSATASCGSDPGLYCEDNIDPANCTGVDRNCSVGQQGYVSCNGVTTWCPNDCDGCPAGWCDGETDCANNCYPCNYTYTCNPTYCTDRCKCNFATCPW